MNLKDLSPSCYTLLQQKDHSLCEIIGSLVGEKHEPKSCKLIVGMITGKTSKNNTIFRNMPDIYCATK